MKHGMHKIALFLVLITFSLYLGCQYQKGWVVEEKPLAPKVKKVVVFGFRPALSQGESSNVIRTPISGTVSMAEPVPEMVVDKMTSTLFNKFLEDKNYDLISPAQARGVFLSLVTSDSTSSDLKMFQRLGRTFSADAVLTGYIYRWREREGTVYAVDRPAAVNFDLYLIRPDDGAILWKGRFEKAQLSLSENLLDMDTFIKGGGKWMSAEKLGELGLDNLLVELLKGKKGQTE
ncbi:MAG: hypothetical protein V1930_08175 [Pseudomonadota bacterium]